MPCTLVYPDVYIRRARKFLRKQPEIRNQYRNMLKLPELDPRHPALRLRSLEGRLEALSSDSIHMNRRSVLEPELRAKRLV